MDTEQAEKAIFKSGEFPCMECTIRLATRRGLCDTCYQRNRRNGTLWQYPRISTLDTTTMHGDEQLNHAIRWVMNYNYDDLLYGLSEYLEGRWVAERIATNYKVSSLGSMGFDIDNVICPECGDIKGEYSRSRRGLCDRCYQYLDRTRGVGEYPTADYVTGVAGYVYYIVNFHRDRLIEIAYAEYGIKIHDSSRPGLGNVIKF